jgi:hypothetical protein
VNGLRLKSLNFSVRGELVEPQKNTFAIGSIIRDKIPIQVSNDKGRGQKRLCLFIKIPVEYRPALLGG